MKIVVFGTGYVGLVQAVGMAHFGFEVIGIDIDEEKVKSLKKREIPFYEPGLGEKLREVLDLGKLNFSLDWNGEGEVVFVCVPTLRMKNGECDLRAVKSVFERLVENDFRGLVVLKSTIPPTEMDELEEKFRDKFEIVSNPEFLREGKAWEDFLKPERIVIGVRSAEAFEKMKRIYAKVEAPIFGMSVESAQLSKYASNTMLAARLSIMNEIANIADLIGADIQDVEKVVGSDRRIGSSFLRSGAGFGGSCFPKDVLALDVVARKFDYEPKLIAPIIDLNEEMVDRFVKKIENKLGDFEGVNFGVWGLTFNANTDDVRESPAIKICRNILEKGGILKVFDPRGAENAKKELKGEIEFVENMEDVLPAESLLVLTEWPEFDVDNWKEIGEKLKYKWIFDGKNFLNRDRIGEGGLDYCGIGICEMDVLDLGNSRLD